MMESMKYEVILMMDNELDSILNPSFVFDSKTMAVDLVETFITQGYEVSIRIVQGE